MGGALTRMLGRSSGVVTDPHWTSTILLCGCNGTNGSAANLADESFAAHSAGASQGSGATDATYDASTKMFGTASARFDSGFNDLIRFADHADWTLGSSDFTLEFFWRTDNATQRTTSSTIMGHWDTTSNQRGWCLQYRGGDATDTLMFFGSAAGSAATTIMTSSAWTPSLSTWYYICVERSGTSFRLYVGEPGGSASMIASATSSLSFFNSTAPLQISGQSQAEDSCMGGVNMDEIRLTTVARYATDAGFPVPSAAFPRG